MNERVCRFREEGRRNETEGEEVTMRGDGGREKLLQRWGRSSIRSEND